MELRQKAPLSDAQIINLYWQRDETAIAETDCKYKKYLYSVAYHIVYDSLDCEECLNDTYLGAWNAIPPTKPRGLKAFLTTIVRRVAVNRYHNKMRKGVVPSEMMVSLSELEPILTDSKDAAAEFDAKRLGRIISAFVRTLSERRRFIFMSRYYEAEPIAAIAGNLGLSRSMVNKELAAIRVALKDTLESEGYFL